MKSRGLARAAPAAFALSGSCIRVFAALGLEFLAHVFKLVFINELDWSDALSLSFQLG